MDEDARLAQQLQDEELARHLFEKEREEHLRLRQQQPQPQPRPPSKQAPQPPSQQQQLHQLEMMHEQERMLWELGDARRDRAPTGAVTTTAAAAAESPFYPSLVTGRSAVPASSGGGAALENGSVFPDVSAAADGPRRNPGGVAESPLLVDLGDDTASGPSLTTPSPAAAPGLSPTFHSLSPSAMAAGGALRQQPRSPQPRSPPPAGATHGPGAMASGAAGKAVVPAPLPAADHLTRELAMQLRIEEEIRRANVHSNMAEALERNPESFAQVGMLFVACQLNAKPLRAYIDSGAQTTVISSALAERCRITRLLDERFAGVARGVGSARILGKVHQVALELGGRSLDCAVFVIDQTVTGIDFILGLDMLRKHRCLIDLDSDCLWVEGLDGIAVPFLAEGQLCAH